MPLMYLSIGAVIRLLCFYLIRARRVTTPQSQLDAEDDEQMIYLSKRYGR